ncbi:30S ribosomal protein S15 [archaeon CG07_land_8_20_14_0_80_38_8]|nr:MAG: 30S ribosomal protein S15 [archaeon CG07_land_8_20_14_0_80_38_8]
MARMHSHSKGKSGSNKPLRTESPKWVGYKGNEVEKLVQKMGSKGMQSAQIGAVLRDEYGVPDVRLITGKKLSHIMKESNNYGEMPEDLFNLLKRAVKVKKHLESSRKDLHSNYGFKLIESKIKRLVKYYKNKKILPSDWTYNIESAKILVE